MDFGEIKTNLEKRGFTVVCFETTEDAKKYLNDKIDGVSVAFGGSMTIKEMGLIESLQAHNTIYSHWNPAPGVTAAETIKLASGSDAYVSSANAISKTGEIVNIDGAGNRVSSLAFGHKAIYYVIGKNKIAESFDSAVTRARNIAAPLNAKRLAKKTPCVVDGKCHDCNSPERICRGMFVALEPMMGVHTEVILVNEDLGY